MDNLCHYWLRLPLDVAQDAVAGLEALIWRAREVAMVMKTRIRKARTIKGYSQAELAKRLSITRSAVANWECGAKLPSSARLQALAIATDVSYEWLATGRGGPMLIPDWTPAIDADIVDEIDERKLLSAYRASTKQSKRKILDFVASTSAAAKRILGSRG